MYFNADIVDLDQISDLDLHCVPLSLLRDTRHKWVKVYNSCEKEFVYQES